MRQQNCLIIILCYLAIIRGGPVGFGFETEIAVLAINAVTLITLRTKAVVKQAPGTRTKLEVLPRDLNKDRNRQGKIKDKKRVHFITVGAAHMVISVSLNTIHRADSLLKAAVHMGRSVSIPT